MKRIILFGASIGISLVICISIYISRYSHWLIALWFISLLLIIFSTLKFKYRNFNKSALIYFIRKKTNIRLLGSFKLLFILLLPLLVRLYFINPERIHQDEFITGYFSAHYDLGTYNFFSAIPQNKLDWQNQFPTLYFVIQRMFFLLFGANPLTLKLSTLPYVFIVSSCLFAITRLILNKKTAYISVLLYSFFAVSVYLESWGLHFISSTAFFLPFFYFLLRYYKYKTSSNAVFAGIFCGFCYLFYFSSYIALPFLLGVFLLQFFVKRELLIIKNLIIALISFFIVLSPFLVYNFKNDNYMILRFKQVSYTNQVNDSKSSKTLVFFDNLKTATKSLYSDGLGGCGGYTFGHLSFFDNFTFLLFIIGSFIAFYLLRKNIFIFFVLLVVLISYIGSMGLTMPPPPYHRFSLAYPFVTIILVLPFYLILKAINNSYFKLFICGSLLGVFIIYNYIHLDRALASDKISEFENQERINIIRYIDKYYPDRKIYIASFPSYSFEKVYYFFNPNRNIETDYHDNLLKKFNTREKYIYIIIFPEVFDNQFIDADPGGRIINNISNNYHLFLN